MRLLLLSTLIAVDIACLPVLAADLGPADFPGDVDVGMPNSYHDAWCRHREIKCRVIISGRSMTIEGYRGIAREQLLGIRGEVDGKERYFYVKYLNSKGEETTALFMFASESAAGEFGEAFTRWYEQDEGQK